MRIIRFFIKLLVLILVIILSVKVGMVCFDGYSMYKSAMEEQSMESRVEEARADSSYADLEYISDDFLNAVISVEDRDFYDHRGVSIKSIGRAVLANMRSGEYSEGGSTITQQVAKNLCFSMEKDMSRKVAELIAAKELEKHYSKDDILELYVNIIYYGDGYMGVGEASMGYFGKAPSELDLNESTLLAGLPQAPSAYALSSNMDRALERQEEVVSAMVSNDVLTEEEAQALLGE